VDSGAWHTHPVVVDRYPTVQLPLGYPAQIRRLLDVAFDGDFTTEDWEHATGGCHIVAVEGDGVVAHASVVPRILEVGGRSIHTGYVEAVAVLPTRQGAGIGKALMASVADVVRVAYEMGALSTEVHDFYADLGWERWRGPTYVRRGSGLVRTEDEDDGVMVLRLGTSQDVDVNTAISCEARRGSDW
jgi:aminoglycoside 2'-N-acetyltransferase I